MLTTNELIRKIYQETIGLDEMVNDREFDEVKLILENEDYSLPEKADFISKTIGLSGNLIRRQIFEILEEHIL